MNHPRSSTIIRLHDCSLIYLARKAVTVLPVQQKQQTFTEQYVTDIPQFFQRPHAKIRRAKPSQQSRDQSPENIFNEYLYDIVQRQLASRVVYQVHCTAEQAKAIYSYQCGTNQWKNTNTERFDADCNGSDGCGKERYLLDEQWEHICVHVRSVCELRSLPPLVRRISVAVPTCELYCRHILGLPSLTAALRVPHAIISEAKIRGRRVENRYSEIHNHANTNIQSVSQKAENAESRIALPLEVTACLSSALSCPIEGSYVPPHRTADASHRAIHALGCTGVIWDDGGGTCPPRQLENALKTTAATGVDTESFVAVMLRPPLESADWRSTDPLKLHTIHRGLTHGLTHYLGAFTAGRDCIENSCSGYSDINKQNRQLSTNIFADSKTRAVYASLPIVPLQDVLSCVINSAAKGVEADADPAPEEEHDGQLKIALAGMEMLQTLRSEYIQKQKEQLERHAMI